MIARKISSHRSTNLISRNGNGVNSIHQSNVHRKTPVWLRAMELTRLVHHCVEESAALPVDELLLELSRASRDISVIIARAYARPDSHTRIYHLNMALEKAAELDSLLMVAFQLQQISFENRRKIEILVVELTTMIKRLDTDEPELT